MSRNPRLRLLPFVLLTIVSFVILVRGQRSWRETETETVYVGKYSNCDYGYYVVLPEGVVGHRGKAPSPNHGITINLENLNSDSRVPDSNIRYVQVYNAYSVGEEKSLEEIVQQQRKAQRQLHKNHLFMSEPARRSLGDLSALEFRSIFHEKDLSISERDVVAYRKKGNILYHLQLVTIPEAAPTDGAVFDAIVAGFHLTRLPLGECSND